MIVEASGGLWIPVEEVKFDQNLESVWTVVDQDKEIETKKKTFCGVSRQKF